jgi:dTDP-4-dehydrorhamnose reductase
MKRPTILITGASSYLAHRLIPVAANYGDVIGLARNAQSVYTPATAIPADLADGDSLAEVLSQARPDIIIHAAAVNPGGDEAMMDPVNHLASARIAEVARKFGSRLIMVSTETVHRGDCAPYADNAQPDPINTYGFTKAAGERAVLDVYPQALIARTSLIYGLAKIDRGTEGFRQRLQSGQPLVLFDDVLRQPVTADHLSAALCELAVQHADVCGTMNLVGSEVMSRAEFGLAMLAHWNIDAGDLVSTRSGAGIDGLPIDLRCHSTMADTLGIKLPGVTEVLASHQ